MKTLLLIAGGEKVFMDACPSRVFISIPGDLPRARERAQPVAANHVASTIENSGPALLRGGEPPPPTVDENAEEF